MGLKKPRCLTERRTAQAKQIRKQSMKGGVDWSPRRGKELIPRKDELANNLTATQTVEQLVLVTPKSTSTPMPSTDSTTQITPTTEMPMNSIQKPSQTLTSSLEAFRVRLSRLLEREKGLMTPVVHSFLKYRGFLPKKDPDIFYSKMLKAYLVMTMEKLSQQYLGFSPTLGMSINGKFLIAKTTEYHRTGKECSLSDILEDNVDPKYFLSEKAISKIVSPQESQI